MRDGSGERLWYALSNKFHANGTTKLNSETLGELTISGSLPASNVIAILFAPGSQLAGQVRDSANANSVGNYLEGDNAIADTNTPTIDTSFTTAPISNTFNDRLVAISNDQLMPVIEKRVAKDVVNFLKNYSLTNGYPFAATLTGMATCSASSTTGKIPLSGSNCPALMWPAWFTANNWNDVIYYARGALSVGSTTGVQTLIIMTGRPLGNTQCNGSLKVQQTRGPSATVCDYLDDTENTNGDTAYSAAHLSATYNDQAFIVAP